MKGLEFVPLWMYPLAGYGAYVILGYATAAVQGWLDAKRAREQEARCDRMEEQAGKLARRIEARSGSLMYARILDDRQAAEWLIEDSKHKRTA